MKRKRRGRRRKLRMLMMVKARSDELEYAGGSKELKEDLIY
jgi:hypothetical protein